MRAVRIKFTLCMAETDEYTVFIQGTWVGPEDVTSAGEINSSKSRHVWHITKRLFIIITQRPMPSKSCFSTMALEALLLLGRCCHCEPTVWTLGQRQISIRGTKGGVLSLMRDQR